MASDLVAALLRPEAYPRRPDRVELRETHVSWVFLAGDRVYKVKKPVRFPFLDYSTPERRRAFCEEEVRLNRRFTSDVYLGVAPVTADLRIRGDGPAVDYAVEMARLPDEGMLDARLRQDRVIRADVERTAARLAEFRARAERVDAGGGAGAMRRIEANLALLRPHAPAAWHARIESDQIEAFSSDACHRLDRRHVESARGAAGHQRDGHGDLHAGNVCLRGDEVVFYDCIEFDPALRHLDVAWEVAFPAMDLERHGAWDFSRAFVDRYVERSGDRDVPALLPLFKRHRACVRGLVETLRPGGAAAGRAYLRLAASYGRGPFLMLVCGLPGTGKSHFAGRAAAAFGADWLRSDLVRKEIYGMPPTEHWRGGIHEGPYAPGITEQTHATLRERTAAAPAERRRAVVDAGLGAAGRREAFRAISRDAGAPLLVVHATCAEAVVKERLARRRDDPEAVSDAGWTIHAAAREAFEPPAPPTIEWDGAGPVEPALDAVVDALVSGSGDAA